MGLRKSLDSHGQVNVVLESGERYELRKGNTNINSDDGQVHVEGMNREAKEYQEVEFPLDSVETIVKPTHIK